MILWDFSHKFSFGDGRFNGPCALWVTAAGGQVVKPATFDSIPSQYHPALFPVWQPWLYLVLALWAIVLLTDACLRLCGRDNGIGSVAAWLRTLPDRVRSREAAKAAGNSSSRRSARR